MQYDPNKWPACWILELIAQDRLHEFYTSGLWLRARARALRNQHRECQRCKARGLIVTEGDSTPYQQGKGTARPCPVGIHTGGQKEFGSALR